MRSAIQAFQRYPLGTHGVTVAAWRAAVGAGTVLALPPAESFGDRTMEIASRLWVVSPGSCLAGCTLLLRDCALPGDRRASFLLAAPPGTAEWRVLAATHGKKAPLLENIDPRPDGLTLRRFNPDASEPGDDAYELVTLSGTHLAGLSPDPALDRLLIESAAYILDAYRRAVNETVAIGHAQGAYWPMYAQLEAAEAAVWSEAIRPLMPAIAAAAATPTNLAPIHRDLARILLQRDQRMLAGDDAQAATAIHAGIETGVRAGAQNTTYGLEDGLFRALCTTPKAADRATIYRTAMSELAPVINKHWLARIPELNAIARRAGASDYAEWMVQRRFGIGTQAYHDIVMDYLRRTQRPYRAMLRELAISADVDRLRVSDAPYWIAQGAGAQLPTLSRAEAMAVITGIMYEMGFDLQQAPFDQIVFDIGPREGKLPAGPMSTAVSADPPVALVFANFSERLTIKALMILVYETLHAVHYQLGAPDAAGWLLLSDHDEAPRHVSKTAAEIVPRLFTDRAFVARALRSCPQFTREQITAFCRAERREHAWRTRRWMLLALYEMLLYRRRGWTSNAPALADDALFAQWHDWVDAHLGLAPETAVAQGDWMTKAHFTSAGFPLFFAAYTLGTAHAEQIARPVLRAGRRGLSVYGAAFRPLFARGGRAEADDLATAVARVRS